MNKILKILGISDKGGRLHELDGIRGIAVLMVFLYHVWTTSGGMQLSLFNKDVSFMLMWGHSGVDLFYILSGFLLFKPFCDRYYLNDGKIDIKNYF
jgi:peptidoglycan/LPS O-acetylase OafA/YrhL